MLSFTGGLKVFIALEPCDLRKSFNGLHALVSECLGEDPRQGGLFVFTNRRIVLELRHHEWLSGRHCEETTNFLKEQGVTLASIDGPSVDAKHFTIMPAADVVTNPRLAYLRLHGRDPKAYLTGKTVAERFHYDYSDTELGEVADRARHLAAEADEVHIVFNNNS